MFNEFSRHAEPSAVLMFNAGPVSDEALGEHWANPHYHTSVSPDGYVAPLNSIDFDVAMHAVDAWRTEEGALSGADEQDGVDF